jgi:hypothetical protein
MKTITCLIPASVALLALVTGAGIATAQTSAQRDSNAFYKQQQQAAEAKRQQNNNSVNRNIDQQRYNSTRPSNSYSPPPRTSYTPPRQTYTPPPRPSYTPPPRPSYTPPPSSSSSYKRR